jgi:serine/threonine-protein kinase
MSPEQFDTHGVDERSDIYSLGILLYEMLTGVLPFQAQTPVGVAILHKTDRPKPPRSLRADLPGWLERAVLRCLEKDPAHRFASAAELAAELRRARAPGPTSRRLPNGDALIEDEAGNTSWALVLSSLHEKKDWTAGMTLRVDERYYRLDTLQGPTGDSKRWTYRFAPWPTGQVFRRLVDYDLDSGGASPTGEKGLGAKLARWMKG